MDSKKKLTIGVVLALIVVALMIGTVLWLVLGSKPQPAPGTPKLSAEIEALREGAQEILEMRPTPMDNKGTILTISDVTTDDVYVIVTHQDNTENKSVKVGHMTTLSGCDVAVLETHPRTIDNPMSGSAASTALISLKCPE